MDVFLLSTKGILHMGFNYTLAERISLVFTNENPVAALDLLGWVWGNDSKSIFEEIIDESPKAPLAPQKRTILHRFIGIFFRAYFEFQNYEYLDQCLPAENPDHFEQHLEGWANVLLEYQQEVPDYKHVLKILVDADENNEEIEIVKDGKNIASYSVHDLFAYLLDDFWDRLDVIVEEIENATFFLLFKDKDFLFRFNNFLRPLVGNLDPSYFDKNGGIIRCTYMPQWLRTAIMHRDNGCCQMCGKNLTGLFDSLDPSDLHFDHVIPLIKYGTNDPANIQILCQHCNGIKGETVDPQQYSYMLPWNMSEDRISHYP